MVLKLYGMAKSTCTLRVAIVLKEKDVPFEFIAIDFKSGEHKSQSYLEKQPFGQVPYIDDDGFILFESRAIGRYVATKYSNQGISLIPTDLKANAKFEQGASIETADFDPSASSFAFEKVFKKFRGQETDEVRAKEHLDKLEGKLDAYEAILGKQKYISGEDVTLADLFHLPYGNMVKILSPGTFAKRPHLAKWFETLESRPSWIAVKDGL